MTALSKILKLQTKRCMIKPKGRTFYLKSHLLHTNAGAVNSSTPKMASETTPYGFTMHNTCPIAVISSLPSLTQSQQQISTRKVPNIFRNTMVESVRFYCGKCMLTFFFPESAKDSKQMQIIIIQSSLKKKQQIQHKTKINKSIKDQVGNHSIKLFAKYSGKMEENFFCGDCKKTVQKSYLYATQIRQRHSQIVPSDSSNIIFRCRRELNQLKIILYYILQAITQDNKQEIYYCCCKPEDKMGTKKMIKHVMDVHRGISPIYGQHITRSQQTQALPPIKSIMDAKQAPSEIAQAEDPIFSIQIKNLEHRKPLLTCYTCNMQFDTTIGYLNHLHKTRNQGQHHLGSHIGLKIKCKCTKNMPQCLFVSAEEEWYIKEPIYYRLCMPERLAMPKLIEHVSLVHSCVSPLYEKPLH